MKADIKDDMQKSLYIGSNNKKFDGWFYYYFKKIFLKNNFLRKLFL